MLLCEFHFPGNIYSYYLHRCQHKESYQVPQIRKERKHGIMVITLTEFGLLAKEHQDLQMYIIDVNSKHTFNYLLTTE